MEKINIFKYNPAFSFFHFLYMKLTKKVQYPQENLGKEVSVKDSGNFNIFLEIDILGQNKVSKKGCAVFQVVFHSPKIDPAIIIKRTRYTIPLFAGLPGFCTKQFMVNKEKRIFSGHYEWETVEMARNYSRSYALSFMKKRSRPLPISYKIIDKTSGETVESANINNIYQGEEK